MITSVAVGKRPVVTPALEVEVRGSGPHIGKSQVLELIRRTLAIHGYGDVVVIKQDQDQPYWTARHDVELHNTNPDLQITLIDNNQKTVGVKA